MGREGGDVVDMMRGGGEGVDQRRDNKHTHTARVAVSALSHRQLLKRLLPLFRMKAPQTMSYTVAGLAAPHCGRLCWKRNRKRLILTGHRRGPRQRFVHMSQKRDWGVNGPV